MALGAGNLIQHASGNTGASFPTSVNVTLSSLTTGGTVLIGLIADESPTAPAGFVQDASDVTLVPKHYLFRKQSSTGETIFTVTWGTSTLVSWWVVEVTGLDSAPLVAGISNHTTSTASISTGTTPTATDTDILCIASYASYISSSTTVTFSGETNSFTEIEDTSTLSVSPAVRAAVALAYRFPGVSGSFQTTATASTSVPDGSGILVVYKAPAAPVSVIDDVSVGGTFGLTAEVTSRSAGDTYLDLYTGDTTVQGSIVLVSDLSVTGTMNYATSAIGVETTSVTFAVGDVVQSDVTGECMVVRDAWTGIAGPEWSNTVTRSSQYTTMGWTVVGTATLS